MATNLAKMTTRSNTKCPWRKFYKCITKYMNILHTEACKPQEKIAKLVYAVTYHFASPAMDLEKDEKSTKQFKGSKESTKQSKRAVQESNNRTKITSNSDTDSAYNTEPESNYAAHLPRPPCSPKPTKQHLQPCPNNSQSITILEEEITSTSTRTHPVPPPRPSKSQEITNTKCIQGTKPLHIPIPKPSTSTQKTSYLSTSKHLQEPSTST